MKKELMMPSIIAVSSLVNFKFAHLTMEQLYQDGRTIARTITLERIQHRYFLKKRSRFL